MEDNKTWPGIIALAIIIGIGLLVAYGTTAMADGLHIFGVILGFIAGTAVVFGMKMKAKAKGMPQITWRWDMVIMLVATVILMSWNFMSKMPSDQLVGYLEIVLGYVFARIAGVIT